MTTHGCHWITVTPAHSLNVAQRGQFTNLQANVWSLKKMKIDTITELDVDCGGSAMATVTNEQVGEDEEDMYEDLGPTYI